MLVKKEENTKKRAQEKGRVHEEAKKGKITMNEPEVDDQYGEQDLAEDEDTTILDSMNWQEFLDQNAISGEESDYIACDEYSSSEDIDEEDITSAQGNISRLTRSFEGEKVLYELEESDEEEFEEYGLNPGDVDTSDEEFQMVKQRVVEYKAEIEMQREEQLSEYEDSDGDIQLISENEDETDVLLRRTRCSLTVGHKTDFKKFMWKVGLRFPTLEMFKEAVKRYGIYNGYSLAFGICDKRMGKVGVRCKKGCPFKLYASWHHKEGCMIVKSASTEHLCVRDMKRNRQLTSKWIAKEYLSRFKENPQWKAEEMMESVRRRYGVIITRWVAYKAKRTAHTMLHGSVKQHYGKIGRFIEELRRSNEGSMFELVTIPASPLVFQRFFICFEGLRSGFMLGCRQFICLDGCFLKTFLGGILLAAVGRDGNNQMFPICWAVVEGENRDSWEWFLNKLKSVLNETNGNGWTFMSDQQKGLLAASAFVFPGAKHRNCARHIYANWQKVHKGDELKLAFWRVVRAYTEADFEEAVEALKLISPQGAEDLLHQNPRVFCKAFFSNESKCDVVVNNMAETFNSYIIKARGKHIIDMLRTISTSLMERMVAKHNLMIDKEEHAICPRIRLKLEEEKVKAWELGVSPSSVTVFQVRESVDVFKVDTENHSCTCKKWDISGIPCHHAVAAISYMNLSAEDFVHKFYKKETYLRAYAKGISPCVSEKFWPKVNSPLDPPLVRLQPGRPKKNRRKCPHEDPKKPGKLSRHGATMRCSKCQSVDHNIRRCPERGNLPCPAEKRPRGRPRKNPTHVGEREQGASAAAAGITNGRVRGRGRGRGKGTRQGASAAVVAAAGIGVIYEERGGFLYRSSASGQVWAYNEGHVEVQGNLAFHQASQDQQSAPFNPT